MNKAFYSILFFQCLIYFFLSILNTFVYKCHIHTHTWTSLKQLTTNSIPFFFFFFFFCMSNRPTLKKSISRNSILLNKKPSKQLIVENAVFPEQQTLPSITVCNLNLFFFLSHHHHLSFLPSFSQVNLQSQSKEKKRQT